jgi:transcriptional regulator with XRE-family HTH domain
MLENNMGKIGEFFKEYREKHGYTMRVLADMLKVQHAYIGKTELGELQLPQELCRKLYPLLDNSEKAQLIQAIKADHALQLKAILESLKSDERRF